MMRKFFLIRHNQLRFMQFRLFSVSASLGFIAALAITGCSSQGVRAETVFVSPVGDDAFNGLAHDVSGRGVGPVRTLQRAQAVARSLKARPSPPPVAIELAGGVYRLDQPIVIGSADSGTADAPLRIYAPTGVSAVLSGGVPIKGWKMNRRGELATTIDLAVFGGTCPSQLFIDGVRRARPRFPAQGTLSIAAPGTPAQPGLAGRLGLLARAGDLPPRLAVSPDTEIVIIDAWTASRLRAVDFSKRSNTLSIQGEFRGRKSRPTLEAGLPYYIENQPVTLLQPGQWQCTRSSSVLRYRPLPGESADALSAVVPVLPTLLTITGSRASPVQNVTIENVAFEDAAWSLPPAGWAAMQAEVGLPAALRVENCRGITLRSITVGHTGAHGLLIGKNCQDVEISDSQFVDLGGGGIEVGSDQRKPKPGSDWEGGPYSRAPTSNVRILRNTIRSLGRIQPGGTGVWVGLADHVSIINNHISDLYYSGISVGWIFNDAISPVHDNVIAGNRIENYGQGVLSDFGGIYTLGRQPGTVVSGNMIANGMARSYGGWGLYADEGSAEITFTDNQVGKTSSEPVFIHNAGAVHLSRNHRLGESSDLFVCPPQGSLLAAPKPPVTFACKAAADQSATSSTK